MRHPLRRVRHSWAANRVPRPPKFPISTSARERHLLAYVEIEPRRPGAFDVLTEPPRTFAGEEGCEVEPNDPKNPPRKWQR